MASKTNLRSIRFSDEIAEIVESQQGSSWNEKFERLVYNCYMLLPERKKELARIEADIRKQQDRLGKLRERGNTLEALIKNQEFRVNDFFNGFKAAADRAEKL